MKPSNLRVWLLAVPLALAAAGCGDTNNVTTPTQPSAPVTAAPEPVTESFGGTIGQGGQFYHALVVRSGAVVTTMAAIGPDASSTLGFSVGVLGTFACSALMENVTAQVGSQLLATATGTTTVCVRIFDNGTIPVDEPRSYEVTVKYMK